MTSNNSDTRLISLIGYSGFIGSHLKNAYGSNIMYEYNSKNVQTSVNIIHDTVICAAPSAQKWWANLHPNEDKTNINMLLDVLRLIKCSKFVLLSTIDVYHNLNGSNELTSVSDDEQEHHAYGRNRAYLEKNCKRIFGDRLHILRLPGLFGFGLRKNIIYDFINGRLKQLNTDSQFQWYALQFLKKDINFMLEHQIKLLNLFPEPLTNKELLEIFESFGSCSDIELVVTNAVTYDCNTIYRQSDKYWLRKDSVIESLKNYLSQMRHSRLIIGTLCFDNFSDYSVISEKYGIKKIEIAPYQHFGHDFVKRPTHDFERYKSENIYSFQSLFFPETFTIYDQYDNVLQYLTKLIDIAEYLNSKVLVFGSPKVRTWPENVTYEQFYEKCKMFFQTVGDYLSSKDVIVCIEPNARTYSCNFLTTSEEARAFILDVNRPKIRLVLDTGCMYLEKENIELAIEKNIDILEHMHLSVPKLESLANKNHNIKFKNVIRCLQKLKYRKLINIEMLKQSLCEIDKSLYELTRSPSIAIVGAGWYGCHIARKLLQKGVYSDIFEKRHIFYGASKFNQNRLHLGFHYPRSYTTRRLCQENHERFIAEYGASVRSIDKNCYIIAAKSLVDFGTYCQIMVASNLDFTVANETVDDLNMINTEGVLYCNEKFLDPIVMRHYFEALLQRFIINSTISKEEMHTLLAEKYDVVLDCTNNQLGLIETYKNCNMIFETTLSLVYKRLSEGPSVAYTFMDGALPSLFPFDFDQNLYSLTHAEYTPLHKTTNVEELQSYIPDAEIVFKHRTAMEDSIRLYIKNFDEKFRYNGYFTSIKVKPCLLSDSRECIVQNDKNIISVSCGKIMGIFHLEDVLRDLEIL